MEDEGDFLLLPKQVSRWLLRAWGQFGKSKSPNWFNQLRLGSGRFLLKSKRNSAGRFPQLSALKQGQRSFVMFLACWNGTGGKKYLMP